MRSCHLDYSGLTFRGRILEDEPLSCHTSLRVGGPADLYAIPEDCADLAELVQWLDDRKIPRIVIGGGYNLLALDGGVSGAVISLERLAALNLVDSDMRLVRAGAGVENLAVVRFAQEHGLGGIEYIAGVPGTVGGALKMNAGAYGSGILERTESLTLLRNGSVAEIRNADLDYGYRRLTLSPGDIIIDALFSLLESDQEAVEEAIRKDMELRRRKHAVGYPSAGSFFKNPSGLAAWRLIDNAGMRGYRIGDAQVSEVHSNFLINRGRATAQDFIDLAEAVKKKVSAVTGVLLEEEVRIVGKR